MHSGIEHVSRGQGARANGGGDDDGGGETPAAGYTVVVADDAPALLDLLTAILSVLAGQLVTARDGEAAWQAIRAHRPRVAVLDADMPLRSGPEVAALVRADPALAVTRILLVTGHAAADAERDARAAGADAWLTKPFRTHELLDAVRALADR